MQTTASENRRSFGPDLIRATAIVLVLLAHTFPGGHTWKSVLNLKVLSGYFGVEIFFLLSGYLIGGILINQLYSERLNSVGDAFSFWKRRWFRTLPNYYLFLFLILLLARCTDGFFPGEAKDYIWFGQSLVSEHPGFFPTAWSLAIEEWFYIFFPLGLLALSKIVSRRPWQVMICIAFFLFVPVLLRWLLPLGGWETGIRRVTLPRLDVITYGVCLAFLQISGIQVWKVLLKLWPVGLIATVCLAGLLIRWQNCGENSNLFFFRVLFFSFTAISLGLCFPKVVEIEMPDNAATAIIRNLSLWSYSIYLSHTLLGGIIVAIFNHFGWSIYKINAVIISCSIWATTLPVSALLYRFYERPIMNLRDRPPLKFLKKTAAGK
ncbi:MAG: acyltransferase [Verrucomicrobiota bacterium]